MKLQRVYIDTSVIGGCFDAEFAVESNRLMQDFVVVRLNAVIYDIVAFEVNKRELKVMVWLSAIREKQATELKDKSVEERLAYYRRKAQALQSKFHKEKVIV